MSEQRTSNEMVAKAVNDMNRFIIIELPGPVTTDERRKIAERLCATLAHEPSADLRAVVQELVDWNTKYPSSRIYGEGQIRRIAAEMDGIFERAKAALATPAQPPNAALEVLQSLSSYVGSGGIDCADPEALGVRIRAGIDDQVQVAIERAAKAIEPADVMTLIDKDGNTPRDVRQANVRRLCAETIRALIPAPPSSASTKSEGRSDD